MGEWNGTLPDDPAQSRIIGAIVRSYMDRIDALQAENAKLRAALEKIINIDQTHPYICNDENGKCYWDHAQSFARAALEGSESRSAS